MKPIPVRMSSDLIEQVDELAASMGMKRSTFIRYVLSRAVGEDAIRSGLQQEVYRMQSVLQPVMQDLYRDFTDQAMERFAEALGIRATDRGPVEVDPVDVLPAPAPRALPAEGGVEGLHGQPVRGRRKRGSVRTT